MKRITFWLILFTSAVVLALAAAAQQQENRPATTSPLVQLLQSKGILTTEEVAMVNQASSPGEINMRLGQLLVGKGLISEQEYKATFAMPIATSGDSSNAHLVN